MGKLKQQVISELNIRPKMTATAIFNFAMEQVNDLSKVMHFMLTDGGYSLGELNRVIKRINTDTHSQFKTK